MQYPKSQQEFLEELFLRPPAEYRGVPFWAWNTHMTKEDIDHSLDTFQKMGMGGCFLHSRTGMCTPYLSDEFMDLIEYANQQAKAKGLYAWLYDEDRWPSGFAGGLVTRNEEYRVRYLVWSPEMLADGEVPEESPKTSTAAAVRSNNRSFLGLYEVVERDGYLSSYERIEGDSWQDKETKDGMFWWAYLEVCGDNPWFNGQSYLDTLNPDAVRKFLDITYERYSERLEQDFGTAIPGIFTDEPQFTPKQRAGSIKSRKAVILPFTDRLLVQFEEEFGYDLLQCLPELFYDRKDCLSQARYHYHRLVSKLFSESYAMQIGAWCSAHGLALTGHLMKEPLLSSQTQYVGEAMLSYPGFQIPGIDILCDRREFTTAKQAQSCVHQWGCEAMISELYGVTNWDFDFRGHKLQGDWQAALGVTIRAPHLAWTSMEGEAKRDYPASISYQSPWYEEYKLIEDYFARIGYVMSRGKARVKIGVIHPVESCWLNWGTVEKTGEIIDELDEQFLRVTDWLLGSGLDFDFISESLLPQLYNGIDEEGISVGEMHYQAVLLPHMKTIRKTTLEIMEEFRSRGGRVVFLGTFPEYADGVKSKRPGELAEVSHMISDSKSALLEELKEFAEIELFYQGYKRADDLLCQTREEVDQRWLFIAHKNAPLHEGMVCRKELMIRQKGRWKCILLDALCGTVKGILPASYDNEWTQLDMEIYEHDSILLHLVPESQACIGLKYFERSDCLLPLNYEALFDGPVPVTLSESNVLVLDMPEYSFDGQPWQAREEILRIDNKLRKTLGYPLRMEAWPQPWIEITKNHSQGDHEEHKIELRYYIKSECHISKVKLGLEQPGDTTVFWNGYPISGKPEGWYTDHRIRTIDLGEVEKGVNELCLVRPFTSQTNLESVYLLGDFGVRTAGSSTMITEPVQELEFGDWTKQGLAFYGANVTYHITVEGKGRPARIMANLFSSPLLRVDYNGKKQGVIAFSPYELETEPIEKGEQQIRITAYGSRFNTFGALHNCDYKDNKAAPDYWRTSGYAWSYEYCLRPAGILKAPVVTV